MGIHVCAYCPPEGQGKYNHTGTGDVTLIFSSGRTWKVPDLILHYIKDHKWRPPDEFVDDVMNSRFLGGSREQTKSIATAIGYLEGPFETGEVTDGFLTKLGVYMVLANGPDYAHIHYIRG